MLRVASRFDFSLPIKSDAMSCCLNDHAVQSFEKGPFSSRLADFLRVHQDMGAVECIRRTRRGHQERYGEAPQLPSDHQGRSDENGPQRGRWLIRPSWVMNQD